LLRFNSTGSVIEIFDKISKRVAKINTATIRPIVGPFDNFEPCLSDTSSEGIYLRGRVGHESIVIEYLTPERPLLSQCIDGIARELGHEEIRADVNEKLGFTPNLSIGSQDLTEKPLSLF
jgi:hypothetical protein